MSDQAFYPLFDNPTIRALYIEMNSSDIVGAKYRIGDLVTFTKQFTAQTSRWTGKVQAVNRIEPNVYEYLIENAPVLAWEEELSA